MDSCPNVLELPNTWTMTFDVFRQIRATVGSLTPETGGMLGGSRDRRLITDFYFDGTASSTRTTYSPDLKQCNRLLREEWNPRGIDLVGFVHSHPGGFPTPSAGDLVYAAKILAVNDNWPAVFLPIAASRIETGAFELNAFAAARDDDEGAVQLEHCNLVCTSSAFDDAPAFFEQLEMFSRVKTAYDLSALERSRVIAIGCGGAASFVEDLARTGVGEFVLIDPDIVSMTNLATQQTYISDVGLSKVAALKRRILDINPYAFIVALPMSLSELTDEEFRHLAFTPFRRDEPRMTLLCGMTDNFFAQSRVNRLALKFALPSLCAQVYPEGRGAEVTFTHPDVTPACHRCLLGSRYHAQLEGQPVAVRSDGTPFGSTARLNALKQFVTMALLHHDTGHARWGQMLTKIATRNLVQVRLDPDVDLPAVAMALNHVDSQFAFCDETVWVPYQLARRTSDCVDCGSADNLRAVQGGFADTRLFDRSASPASNDTKH